MPDRVITSYSIHYTKLYDFLQLGDKGDEDLAEGLKNLSKDKSLLFTKKRHYRKGGKPFYVNINMSYAKYGEIDVIIAATTDITEVVEKETQLVQAGKMTTLGVMAAGRITSYNVCYTKLLRNYKLL